MPVHHDHGETPYPELCANGIVTLTSANSTIRLFHDDLKLIAFSVPLFGSRVSWACAVQCVQAASCLNLICGQLRAREVKSMHSQSISWANSRLIAMDVGCPTSVSALVAAPEAVLHQYRQLLHRFSKALQNEFLFIDCKWVIQIVSRFDDRDAEVFPLQEADSDDDGRQYDLRDQFKELRACIEEAKLKQTANQNKEHTNPQEANGPSERGVQLQSMRSAHAFASEVSQVQAQQNHMPGRHCHGGDAGRPNRARQADAVPLQPLHADGGQNVSLRPARMPAAARALPSSPASKVAISSDGGPMNLLANAAECNTAVPAMPLAEPAAVAQDSVACGLYVKPRVLCCDHVFLHDNQIGPQLCGPVDPSATAGERQRSPCAFAASHHAESVAVAVEAPSYGMGHAVEFPQQLRGACHQSRPHPTLPASPCVGSGALLSDIFAVRTTASSPSQAPDDVLLRQPPMARRNAVAAHVAIHDLPPADHTCVSDFMPVTATEAQTESLRVNSAVPARTSIHTSASLVSGAVDASDSAAGDHDEAQSCPGSSSSHPTPSLEDLFKVASGPCLAEGSNARQSHHANSSSCPLLPSLEYHIATADAVIRCSHSLADPGSDGADDGPSTPAARPAHHIRCLGSAPAAVLRQIDEQFFGPENACDPHPAQLRGVHPVVAEHGVHMATSRAKSVDSFPEAVQQLLCGPPTTSAGPTIDATDGQVDSRLQGVLEAPGLLRDMAARLPSVLDASRFQGSAVLDSGPSTLPICSTAAGLPCSTIHDVTLGIQTREDAFAFAAPANQGIHTGPGALCADWPPYDPRFADPESSDEAPLAPQPLACEIVSSAVVRTAKQQRRKVQHSSATCASGQADGQLQLFASLAARDQDLGRCPSPGDGATERTGCHSNRLQHAVPGPQQSQAVGVALPVALQFANPGRPPMNASPVDQATPPQELPAEPLTHPRASSAQEERSFLAVASRLSPEQRIEPVQSLLHDVPAGPVRPGASHAERSSQAEYGKPAAHQQQKRGRHHVVLPNVTGELGEQVPRRFHEPCSEHVEGVFPGRVAKRTRLEDAPNVAALWPDEDHVELDEDLEVGPVTVDHIQQVVERRLQVAPGWRAQRRQVNLARAQRTDFREFIRRILDNDPTLGECASRVLRLKPTLDLDTTTFEIDMVLEALRYNYRIEALYIHNFEQGFADPQLERLMKLLRNGRIWACNIGENFLVTNNGWKRFLGDIPDTALAFTYVSEAHLKRTDLKVKMRAAIRLNRILSPRRDPEVCKHISNMWFNPTGCNSRHYGCASEKEHERRAASASPLAQVKADREREVASIARAKAIYAKFASFRSHLLRNKVDPSAREKALDPREAEPQLQGNTTTAQAHEIVPVNVDVVPELPPFLEDVQPPRYRAALYKCPEGSVGTHDLPCCVRELMVPHAQLPAPILQRCGKGVDGIEEEQEAEERRQAVVASKERADEVAAGIAQQGLDAIVYAVGTQEAQQCWVDERRIRKGSPRDFSDDTLAWAVKCIGGHLAARKEIEGGLSVLEGSRIDLFLPEYVQWVAARVISTDCSTATLKFWNGQTGDIKLQDSLVAWRLPKSELMPEAGLSIDALDSFP
eukprot:jgi/Ulvmu1/4072/UM019_0050.1